MYACYVFLHGYITEECTMACSPVDLHDQLSRLSRAFRPFSYWLVHCFQLLAGSLLKFVPEVHHVSQVLSKYANLSLKILCCRIPDTDFPTIFLNWAVVKILYMFSFCFRLNQCKFGPSILFFHGVIFFHSFRPFFAFFKFAKWAEVCRTRKSSRKRITRTSLGLR